MNPLILPCTAVSPGAEQTRPFLTLISIWHLVEGFCCCLSLIYAHPSPRARPWLANARECRPPIGPHWPQLPAEDQRSSCEGGRRPGSRKQARRRFVKRKIRNDEMMISRPRLRVSIWPLIGSFKKPEHTFWMCPKMFQEIDTFEIKIWGTSIIHVKNVRGYNENILTQNQAFLTVVIVSRRDRV